MLNYVRKLKTEEFEKPGKYMIETKIPFVTIEDVEKQPSDLNYVLYNPKFPFEERKKKLDEVVRLHYGVQLDESQLNKLCKFDSDHCDRFIEEFNFMRKYF